MQNLAIGQKLLQLPQSLLPQEEEKGQGGRERTRSTQLRFTRQKQAQEPHESVQSLGRVSLYPRLVNHRVPQTSLP